MSRYSEFFLSSSSTVAQLELVEVSHPNFSQAHRFVRNAADGVTVDLSDDEPDIFFQFYPAKISNVGARDDLDAGIKMDLGDLGELIPAELDLVDEAGGWLTKPTVRYWVYRSDDLTQPIFGPLHLEIGNIDFIDSGASFEARAPLLNMVRTGEAYKLERFPMLRGFL